MQYRVIMDHDILKVDCIDYNDNDHSYGDGNGDSIEILFIV